MIYCINRSKFTKNSKGNSPMLKNIKIILLINIITLAFDANIKAASKKMTLTRNNDNSIINSQPATPIIEPSTQNPLFPKQRLTESTVPTNKPEIQGHNDEFVMIPKQTEEQIKEEQIKSARAKISKILGTEYLIPELEPQHIVTRYPMPKLSNLWHSQTEHMIEWIDFGCYDKAYREIQEITAYNSQAIDDLTSQLALEASANQTTIVSLLEQSRQNIIKTGTHFLLLLAAINQHQHPKKINPTNLKTTFEKIQKMRKNNQARAKVEMAEHHALDNYLKTMQEELSKAHPGEQTSLPLTPRKGLEDFTESCLESE